MHKKSNLVPVLLLFLILPAVGLFCWQIGGTSGESKQASPPSQESTIGSIQGLRTLPSGFNKSLTSTPDAPFSPSGISSLDNFFSTGLTRAMIVAQGDPFMESLVLGVSDGELSQQSGTGIPIYGPTRPSRPAARYSDREILLAMQLGVGGSFKSFFEDIFDTEEVEKKESSQGDDISEENPFLKAIESMAENLIQGEPADTETQPADDDGETAPSPSEQDTPVSGVAMPGRSVTTERPLMILRIDENGSLIAMPASQPRPGTFETAETGYQDFTVLPFTDTTGLAIAIATADFNRDSYPDVCIKVGFQDTIRFFYGSEGGTYTESMQAKVGRGARSIAAGDFNGDGFVDLAISATGTGIVTLLWNSPDGPDRFSTFWSDTYRDYIAAADTSGEGHVDLVGMNFANRAQVMRDFADPEGTPSEQEFTYQPSLDTQVETVDGTLTRINAVVLASHLSVNLENGDGQLTNVLNVSAGSNVSVIIGDLNNDGNLAVGIASPKSQ